MRLYEGKFFNVSSAEEIWGVVQSVVLSLHRKGHWCMLVADMGNSRLYFFDSLAQSTELDELRTLGTNAVKFKCGELYGRGWSDTPLSDDDLPRFDMFVATRKFNLMVGTVGHILPLPHTPC